MQGAAKRWRPLHVERVVPQLKFELLLAGVNDGTYTAHLIIGSIVSRGA